ncbi:reverse transcriptase domain-containing protein, partial [Fusobacterium polymorphum]
MKDKFKTINISHGFVKERNIITNAKIHKNKKIVLNLDLKDFFDSFHFGRIKGFFEKNKDFKFSPELATLIAQLACYNGKLPQGAPSSPLITNLICHIFDI